ARLATALARDRRVPNRSRVMLAAGAAYLVSPVDLVPGVIPVAGQIDDLYVVLVALRQALRMAPPEVSAEYQVRYQVDTAIIDNDLAAIRTLVRIGLADGARWSLARL